MRLHVLGPLEVHLDGAAVRVPSAQQRRLLTALSLAPNRVVSNDQLMAALWDDQLPPSALKSLRAHVSRLRDVLHDDACTTIATGPDGYRLRIDRDELDADRFERLALRARQRKRDDPQRALEMFEAGLALWRGPAFAEFAQERFVRPDAVRLEELRRSAFEDRFDLLLASGRHGEIIADIEGFAQRQPLRERPQRQLVLALYRDGRHADALAVVRAFRSRLADDLGLRPSAAMQALEQDILRQDPRLDVPGLDHTGLSPMTSTTPAPAPTSPDGRAPTATVPLLERNAELAQLHVLLEEVGRSRQGRLVIVHGEAGIGKSALINAFCRDQGHGTRIQWGSCDPLFTPRPLGPFRDVAASSGGKLYDLVRTGAEPYDVAAALFEELATAAPTVVVLEDLQWADEATLDVVRLLARRVRTVPALVVLSYRDDQLAANHLLRHVLGELTTLEGTVQVPLRPLSRSAVSQLAAPHGRDGTHIHAVTSGNPLFVTEVLATRGDDVPESVLRAVVSRADDLDPDARTVLDVAAVSPPRIETRLLEAVAGGAADRLDACVSSGLLTADATSVAFRHELTRRAIESTIPPHRRRELHRRILEVLSSVPEDDHDLPRLVHHADAAGNVDAVLRVGRSAAKHAADVGAHREAAAYCARVLRHGDRLDPQLRAAVLEQYAAACSLSDEIGSAIRAMEQAMLLHRRLGDQPSEGNALRILARLLWGAGRTIEATALARQAVQLLESQAVSSELGMARADAGWLALSAGNRERATEHSVRAREVGRALDDVRVTVEANRTLAAVAVLSGDTGAYDQFDECVAAAESAGLHEHVSETLLTKAACALKRYDYGVATDAASGAEALCRTRGHELTLVYVQAYQAALALDLGQWTRAGDLAGAVLRHPRNAAIPRVLALVVTALIAARSGADDPRPIIDRAQRLAAPTGELEQLVAVASARAEIAWLADRSDEVLLTTDGAYRLARELRASWAIGPLAAWRLRAGGHCELHEGAAVPHLLQAAGRHADAADWWLSRGCAYNAALSLLDAGDAGSRATAGALLRELGATVPADRAARHLAR